MKIIKIEPRQCFTHIEIDKITLSNIKKVCNDKTIKRYDVYNMENTEYIIFASITSKDKLKNTHIIPNYNKKEDLWGIVCIAKKEKK